MTGLRDTEAALALLDEAVNAATAGDTPAMADLACACSPTPTHGCYATIIFRQLGDQVGLLEPNPLDHASIESIYEEATDWLANL